MGEGQIVIISVLGLMLFTSLFISYSSEKFEYKPLSFLLGMFSTMVLLVIVITTTMELNVLREKLENQCPQYERVENVYRLKE